MMDTGYIAVGDELLDGRIQESNLDRLGSVLGEYGVTLQTAQIVPDRVDAIRRSLETVARRRDVDLVVVSGGLGPTRDDVTRDGAAEWAGVDLELDPDQLQALKELFDTHGFEFTANNRRQCQFPTGADVLDSEVGTASGFRLDHDGLEAYFFPGVPSEFRWYVDHHLRARLDRSATLQPRSKATLTFLGPGESTLEDRLEDTLDDAESAGAEARFLAHMPLVTLELSGDDADLVDSLRASALEQFGDALVAEGDETPAERLGGRLEARGDRVAVAESCTGGGIAEQLTSVPGSSSWFEYGYVTYADRAKRELLGVRPETLETHGAVSAQTVREMAQGARERSKSDWALSVSGIAGPSGGTPEKPVGRVYFALAGPDATYHRRATFPDRGRAFVRHASVLTALGSLIWKLEGRLTAHDWQTRRET